MCKNVFDVLGDFLFCLGMPQISKVHRRSQRAMSSEEMLHMCLPRIRKEHSGFLFTFAQDLRLLCSVSNTSLRFQPFNPKLFLHHLALHFFTLNFSARCIPFLLPTCKDSPHPSNPASVPRKLSLIIPGKKELFFFPSLGAYCPCRYSMGYTWKLVSPTTKLTPRV